VLGLAALVGAYPYDVPVTPNPHPGNPKPDNAETPTRKFKPRKPETRKRRTPDPETENLETRNSETRTTEHDTQNPEDLKVPTLAREQEWMPDVLVQLAGHVLDPSPINQVRQLI
jgi:hypothetical protein